MDNAWPVGGTASVVVIGNFISILSVDGELSFVPVSRDGYRTAAYYTFKDKTWAHPAFVDGHIIIKEDRYVSVWKF